MDQKANPVKIPPHDAHAEKSVLGGVLIDAGAIVEVAEILQARHFYFAENRYIFEAALVLFEKSKPIDIITVAAELKEQGTIKQTGGKEYLNELIEDVYKRQPPHTRLSVKASRCCLQVGLVAMRYTTIVRDILGRSCGLFCFHL